MAYVAVNAIRNALSTLKSLIFASPSISFFFFLRFRVTLKNIPCGLRSPFPSGQPQTPHIELTMKHNSNIWVCRLTLASEIYKHKCTLHSTALVNIHPFHKRTSRYRAILFTREINIHNHMWHTCKIRMGALIKRSTNSTETYECKHVSTYLTVKIKYPGTLPESQARD